MININNSNSHLPFILPSILMTKYFKDAQTKNKLMQMKPNLSLNSLIKDF